MLLLLLMDKRMGPWCNLLDTKTRTFESAPPRRVCVSWEILVSLARPPSTPRGSLQWPCGLRGDVGSLSCAYQLIMFVWGLGNTLRFLRALRLDGAFLPDFTRQSLPRPFHRRGLVSGRIAPSHVSRWHHVRAETKLSGSPRMERTDRLPYVNHV